MAFDTATRNKLARMVADARRLLTEEYTKQLQEMYGIQPDGYVEELTKLTHLDDEQKDIATLLCERIEHLASVMKSEKKPVAAAIDRMTREQAFTTLNRFAALRMCEERRLVQECVRKGLQSKGFLVYLKTAGSDLGDHYDRYRAYLFCVFDEIAVDLGVLFDRFSPFGLLFPREPALLELITIINDEELKHIWAEDETIGWIYQYFNTQEERRAMRDASSAPRNSYELAVRNQFFTPRYVVQFLTDNTLGRIWYEMRKGQTSLNEKCQYLVRRPNEIFLKAGEEAPEAGDKEEKEDLSQEQLLRQPVYIPHRAKKDPREIKILDPACGSGHFLLYAFDLLETIYQEAWDDPELGGNLKKDFPSPEDFRRAVPVLILRYNLHGIDIDARCVQIGSLSLWLRAQKVYKEIGLKPIERPKITKTNIVTAEPMPGEKDLLKEFTAKLKTPALGQLVEIVFDKMQLAGEAGSLLMIEEEIRSAVSEAKKLWLQGPKQEQLRLFGDMPRQTQLKLDFSGISDEQFWDQAEERIYSALEAYAEQAENGSDYLRRLFTDDAARGFAFIDLCRKRYDVVLMNPPFGEASENIRSLLRGFSSFSDNIAAPFAERFLASSEFLGMVLDRALLIRKTHESFRRLFLAKGNNRLRGFTNYGWGVLDAYVEVAGLVAANRNTKACYLLTQEGESEQLKWLLTDGFAALPNLVISGDVPDFVINVFASNASLGDSPNAARVGHQWKSERYLRLWWEGASLGPYVYNGAPFSPYAFTTRNRMTYDPKSEEVQNESSTVLRNRSYHYLPGIAYGKRGSHLDAHLLPAGQTFTVEGLACFPSSESDRFTLLAYLNSLPVSALLAFFCGQHKHVGYVNCLPFSTRWQLSSPTKNLLRVYTRNKRGMLITDETSPIFASNIDETILQLGLSEGFKAFSKALDGLTDTFNRLHASVSQEIAGWLRFPQDWESLPGLKDTVESFPAYASTDIFDEPDFHSPSAYSARIVGSLVGFAYGRWDIRFATGEKPTPELPDAFAPLPVCPPGMLQNEKGLPAERKDVPADYPLRISWPGILVDDPNHPEDIERRVHEGIEVIWKDKAEDIEHEACEILGVKSLKEYFQKPSCFFADHLKRYSKSRRKAPIYWPLASANGSYTLWMYYHQLTDQTLFTCVTDFVEPKLGEVSRDIDRLQKQLSEGGTPKQRDELEKLQDFRQELTDFRDELLRITKLPYKPNLNDGVIITASPLWKLYRHNRWSRDLKAYWDKLEAGEYDWAHLAYSIWPERVKEKCRTDRSIAIAHDLEQLCEVQIPKKKAKTKKRKKQDETEMPYDN